MKVLGFKIKCKGMEFIDMLMVQFIKDNGNRINNKVEDNMNFLMVQFMMENGKII